MAMTNLVVDDWLVVDQEGLRVVHTWWVVDHLLLQGQQTDSDRGNTDTAVSIDSVAIKTVDSGKADTVDSTKGDTVVSTKAKADTVVSVSNWEHATDNVSRHGRSADEQGAHEEFHF